MGYETTLHLIGIRIKPASLPAVQRAIKSRKGKGFKDLEYFLSRLKIVCGNELEFKATKGGGDPYCPFEETNTVVALYGKWYEAEKIATWLKIYCEKGGRIVLHSIEGDGEAWGWEFDGRGKMRQLVLLPMGKWK